MAPTWKVDVCVTVERGLVEREIGNYGNHEIRRLKSNTVPMKKIETKNAAETYKLQKTSEKMELKSGKIVLKKGSLIYSSEKYVRHVSEMKREE